MNAENPVHCLGVTEREKESATPETEGIGDGKPPNRRERRTNENGAPKPTTLREYRRENK